MITKYKTSFATKISTVLVLEETKHMVVTKILPSGKKQREAKRSVSEYSCYFDTWEEAHTHLLNVNQQKLTKARTLFLAAKADRVKIQRMQP